MYDIENPMTIGAECAADQDSCDCPFCGRRWAFNVVQRQPEWYCADADIFVSDYRSPVGDWCPACEDAYNEEQDRLSKDAERKKKTNERVRAWRTKNHEHVLEYRRRYYHAHKEQISVCNKRYHQSEKGKEKLRESKNRWMEAHRDAVLRMNRKSQAKFYAMHKNDPAYRQKRAEAQRAYRARKKEAMANG